MGDRRAKAGFHALALGLGALFAAGCVRAPAAPGTPGDLDAIARELDALSRGLTDAYRATFHDILEDTLAKDAYVCHPLPRDVFFGDAPEGERTIAGEMPHYGFFFGPMRYTVRRRGGRWQVRVRIGVEPPRSLSGARAMELPDCALVRAQGQGRCEGVPYAQAEGTEACPSSGRFSMPATPANMRALLARWSSEAEQYYSRDAAFFGLPVDYDFDFVELGEGRESGPPRVDMVVPLSLTCGRTPYFSAFRSGWSIPIVAHEVGHVLGLLDEYETFSGIAPFYPKTPFPGAEVSRMGLSMREGTRVLPLHHYLILRRYLCPEPRERSFFEGAGL